MAYLPTDSVGDAVARVPGVRWLGGFAFVRPVTVSVPPGPGDHRPSSGSRRARAAGARTVEAGFRLDHRWLHRGWGMPDGRVSRREVSIEIGRPPTSRPSPGPSGSQMMGLPCPRVSRAPPRRRTARRDQWARFYSRARSAHAQSGEISAPGRRVHRLRAPRRLSSRPAERTDGVGRNLRAGNGRNETNPEELLDALDPDRAPSPRRWPAARRAGLRGHR